jgi:hypothetical protein
VRGRVRGLTKVNHDYFANVDSEKRAYWLGFSFADGMVIDKVAKGSMLFSVHLAQRDRGHLETLRRELEANNKAVVTKAGGARLTVSSDKICSDLIRYGCTPRKSLTVQYPSIHEEFGRHFVRGYFDGNGSVCVHRGRAFVSVYTGSLAFAHALHSAVQAKQNVVKRKTNCYAVVVSGRNDVVRLFSFMYDDATVWLDRKRQPLEEWLHADPVKETKSCDWCDTSFEIGRAVARSDRRYCSKRCRDATNRERRRQLCASIR